MERNWYETYMKNDRERVYDLIAASSVPLTDRIISSTLGIDMMSTRRHRIRLERDQRIEAAPYREIHAGGPNLKAWVAIH